MYYFQKEFLEPAWCAFSHSRCCNVYAGVASSSLNCNDEHSAQPTHEERETQARNIPVSAQVTEILGLFVTSATTSLS